MTATDRLTSLATTVYVIEPAKVLYVKASKSACTTMLWTIIDLAGIDPASIGFAARPSVMRSQVVHDASIHPVPTIDQVRPELRLEALTSPDWMRLGITRDPYARFYSAWESRILLDNPGQWQQFPQPPLVATADELAVTASFRSFAAAMATERGIWQSDPHFAQQAHVLALDEIDYTDLVPTTGLADLFVRLGERVGRDITPGRFNEGLKIPYAPIFDPTTAAICEDLYAEDFARLGFPRREFAEAEPVVLRGPAKKALDMIHDRNERIVDLSLHLRGLLGRP